MFLRGEITGDGAEWPGQAVCKHLAEIPDPRRVVAFRNLLIHAYDSIDDGTVWDIATKDLNAMIAALQALLEST
jgi:uncharacterized protein with HEPN domain